uniref:F-box domain-containing protein n=1 Tax=Panagrellus redivivus TaxID=6233 RepID=A0A7E4V5Z8_PANRE
MEYGLKHHLFDDITLLLGQSHDAALSLIKFSITGKESFAAVCGFIRDHVDVCFDKYELEFRFNEKPVDLKQQTAFFAERVQKFVMKFPVRECYIEHEEEAKLDCEALKVLDNNHAIDTATFGTEYNDIPDFLSAFLRRWPTVKTLACRSKLLVDALRDDATMLSKFETLEVFWDFEDICKILKVCPLLPTLKHLQIFNDGFNKNLLKCVFGPMPSVNTLKLTLNVEDISGSYFNDVLVFLKHFPNLEHADVVVKNVELCPMDTLLAKVNELHTGFKEVDFKVEMRFKLCENYDTTVHQDNNVPFMVDGEPNVQAVMASLMAFSFSGGPIPEDVVTKLTADGFENVSKNAYRRVWKYPGKTFIYDVGFTR